MNGNCDAQSRATAVAEVFPMRTARKLPLTSRFPRWLVSNELLWFRCLGVSEDLGVVLAWVGQPWQVGAAAVVVGVRFNGFRGLCQRPERAWMALQWFIAAPPPSIRPRW